MTITDIFDSGHHHLGLDDRPPVDRVSRISRSELHNRLRDLRQERDARHHDSVPLVRISLAAAVRHRLSTHGKILQSLTRNLPGFYH